MSASIRTRGYHPKIYAMKQSQALREEIERDKEKIRQVRFDNYTRFIELLDGLKAVDPTGWEAWYDDPRNVPNTITWTEAAPILERMGNRLQEVRARK